MLVLQEVTAEKFAVLRRTCVEPDYTRQMKKQWQRGFDINSVNIQAGK